MELKDKIAIVTGVSKGIGLATVKTLLEKGVKVAGWGRSAPKIKHPNFAFYLTDVRDSESVQESYNATVEDFGGDISILINNAGLGYQAKMEEMALEQWHEMFETNVNGIFIVPD
jgi:NAD(P)-dependent dehydrogenase (short-subunit alcohol dehydrogenase family)